MNPVKKLPFDPEVIRQDFPILNQRIYKDKPLTYLDNAASTQRPTDVIQAMVDCYQLTYANVHRGIHYLSEQSSHLYEESRKKVAQFIGAEKEFDVIFTSGTTHAVNLVAYSWGSQNVKAGDEILLSIMEHHSNIVPWQQLAERTGAIIRWIDITEDGRLDLDSFESQLSEQTKLVAVCAVSNVLGTINPIKKITELSHAAGAKVFIDAAQQVPHAKTNVVDWDVDFLAFSAHKMLGPSGIGILYAKQDILESMSPFLGGGSMITSVTTDGYTPAELPAKFEAGTPPIAQAIGLGKAIDYLSKFDMSEILMHEQQLAMQATDGLQNVDGIKFFGPELDHQERQAEQKAGIVSFIIEGLSSQDISVLLDRQGVAIRVGHHCAMPLHDRLNISNSCRASFYLYNTQDEVDYFCQALEGVVAKLR